MLEGGVFFRDKKNGAASIRAILARTAPTEYGAHKSLHEIVLSQYMDRVRQLAGIATRHGGFHCRNVDDLQPIAINVCGGRE